MKSVHAHGSSTARDGPAIAAARDSNVVLNPLRDPAEEEAGLADTLRAMLNVLEDAASDKSRLEATQTAILNILADSAEEKAQLGDTQRAILNLLEDSAGEKTRLEATQSAILNVLEDSDGEKSRLVGTQSAILNVLEDSDGEKARLAETERALLNILDDFDLEEKKVEQASREKKSVEQANVALRNEIEERARAEEALRLAKAAAEAASSELEAFSYSVAHDLRTPLRSIDGFSQALLEDYTHGLDVDGQRYLANVRASAQHMGKLIDDLLNLSRVTRADLHREPVDLSELARSVLARLRDSQPDRLVDSVIQNGLMAQADPPLLELVLTNLLGNAWKFTSKRASARIEFAARADANPRVYYVRDNGAGFDARFADKLFGVFQRLHAAHEYEGTGIGLATVRRIISRHGGRIWAEGEMGRGATFYFTLEEEQP